MQRGRVVNAHRRKHRLQFVERRLNAARDFHRVRAVLTGSGHQHAGLAVDDCVAEFWFRRFNDIRHVLQADAASVALRYDDFAELRRRERLAFGLEHEPLRRGFHKTRAAHAGRCAGRCGNFLNGNTKGAQPIRPDLNLQLPHFATENFRRRHTGHGQQARPHRPIRKRPQRHRRKFFRGEAELEQVHR